MTSDFWVGMYVKVHLMISDVGRWVGQFLDFCFFPFISRFPILKLAMVKR